MRRVSIATGVCCANFVIVGNVGIVIGRDDFAVETIVAPTISSDLLRKGSIRCIGMRARFVWQTLIDRTRILIITIRVG
jgi:urocanate hydratase